MCVDYTRDGPIVFEHDSVVVRRAAPRVYVASWVEQVDMCATLARTEMGGDAFDLSVMLRDELVNGRTSTAWGGFATSSDTLHTTYGVTRTAPMGFALSNETAFDRLARKLVMTLDEDAAWMSWHLVSVVGDDEHDVFAHEVAHVAWDSDDAYRCTQRGVLERTSVEHPTVHAAAVRALLASGYTRDEVEDELHAYLVGGCDKIVDDVVEHVRSLGTRCSTREVSSTLEAMATDVRSILTSWWTERQETS